MDIKYTVFREYDKVELKEAEEYIVSAEQEKDTLKKKNIKIHKIVGCVTICACIIHVACIIAIIAFAFLYSMSDEKLMCFIYIVIGINVTIFIVEGIIDILFKYKENKNRLEEILDKCEYYKEYIDDVNGLNEFVILSVKMVEGMIYVIYTKPDEKHICVEKYNKKEVEIAEDKDCAEVYIYCDIDTNPLINKIIIPYGII